MNPVDYEFSIVRADEEIEAAFRLRYAVFVEEVGAFPAMQDGLERDAYDAHSMHFVAKLAGTIVGTVRVQKCAPVLARTRGTRFGLPGEEHYDYAPFEDDRVPVAEVSRSSVLPDHRGSKVLANLWKIAYNAARRAGCTHFMSLGHVGYTDSLVDANIVYDLVERAGMLHPRYHLTRRAEASNPERPRFPLFTDAERQDAAHLRLPAMVRLFHRFGLRACGRPVFVLSIGRVGLPMLACPETFSPATLEFFHAPDPAHRLE